MRGIEEEAASSSLLDPTTGTCKRRGLAQSVPGLVASARQAESTTFNVVVMANVFAEGRDGQCVRRGPQSVRESDASKSSRDSASAALTSKVSRSQK